MKKVFALTVLLIFSLALTVAVYATEDFEVVLCEEAIAVDNASSLLSQIVATTATEESLSRGQSSLTYFESATVTMTFLFEDGTTMTNEVHFEGGQVVYVSTGNFAIMMSDGFGADLELSPTELFEQRMASDIFVTEHQTWTQGRPLPPSAFFRVSATRDGRMYLWDGNIPRTSYALLTSVPVVYRLTFQGWLRFRHWIWI